MSNPFIESEIKKILEDKTLEFPKNIAMASAWIIANFKGVNIKVLDVAGSSSLCDFNIIASAENTIQARSMVEEILTNFRKNDIVPLSVEGVRDGEWMLLDLGDVIVHIFQEVARDVFDLDNLWSEFPHVEIPQDYYFSHAEIDSAKKDDPADNYF